MEEHYSVRRLGLALTLALDYWVCGWAQQLQPSSSPAALRPAEQAVDSYCTGPHARISQQKAAAYHLQCLLFCCCSLRLASHEEMPCMGQRGRCSVLFPRDRSWFIYTISNSFDQIILSPATILYNTTPSVSNSVSNCRSFDFFNPKFDHSSYSKICAKYHFFIVACFISTSSWRTV